jgi:signal peptide peptidase SppA
MEAEISLMTSRPWSCEPSHGSAFLASLEEAVRARRAGAQAPQPRNALAASIINGVASFDLKGPMLHRPAAWLAEWGIEHTDTLALAAQIAAAESDPSVKSIQINADSPGGMVAGTPELADAIAAAKKPVHVKVDGMLCSAAVYATAHADSISATKSSEIGAIGVYTVLADKTKMLDDVGIKLHLVSSGGIKGAGADGRVTDAKLADEQRVINQMCAAFVETLSAGRGRDLSDRATGQVWLAADAQRIGLIDTITGAAAPNDTIEDSMDLNPLAALAAKHPTKAGEILAMAAAGKTDAEIGVAMESAAHADAIAAAEKVAADAKIAADKATADLKAEQDKSAALAAEVADLKAKLAESEKSAGKIAAARLAAPADPGDAQVVQVITRDEFAKNPAAHSAALAAGRTIVKNS